MHSKVSYLQSSFRKTLARQGLACPSCGSIKSNVVSRKYLVTALRRCASCALLFRAPTTSQAESDAYYQDEYKSGFTTELPDESTLASYLANGFAGTPKDFSRYIKILQALGCKPGDRLMDFGCSWGYGSRQFQQHGFFVVGFELSKNRAEFARRQLNLSVISNLQEHENTFDVFFSAHVLEHIPPLRETLNSAFRVLKPGGLFIGITPNGSAEYRAKNPGGWQRSWGLKHPNLIDAVFYEKTFAEQHSLVTSELGNFAAMSAWLEATESSRGKLDGWELLVACRA